MTNDLPCLAGDVVECEFDPEQNDRDAERFLRKRKRSKHPRLNKR